jgi:hypothetical protein
VVYNITLNNLIAPCLNDFCKTIDEGLHNIVSISIIHV